MISPNTKLFNRSNDLGRVIPGQTVTFVTGPDQSFAPLTREEWTVGEPMTEPATPTKEKLLHDLGRALLAV